MTDLENLIEKVRQATGPDRELDIRLEWTTNGASYSDAEVTQVCEVFADQEYGKTSIADQFGIPRYTYGVDAALALVERLLPGWRWGVSAHSIKDGVYLDGPYTGKPKHADGFRAHVTERSALRPMPSVADAPTAPLAIVLALLSALSQQEAK